jgi:ABC-type uncharacterized transport system permease subunit
MRMTEIIGAFCVALLCGAAAGAMSGKLWVGVVIAILSGGAIYLLMKYLDPEAFSKNG